MLAAADLATDHQLGLWDAVILSAASKAGCRLLLSETFSMASRGAVLPWSTPLRRRGTLYWTHC
jgi:hypothetical protein